MCFCRNALLRRIIQDRILVGVNIDAVQNNDRNKPVLQIWIWSGSSKWCIYMQPFLSDCSFIRIICVYVDVATVSQLLSLDPKASRGADFTGWRFAYDPRATVWPPLLDIYFCCQVELKKKQGWMDGWKKCANTCVVHVLL